MDSLQRIGEERREYLVEQLHAVRDACDHRMRKDGRSISSHLHCVWMNYQDFFLDHCQFLRIVVSEGLKGSVAVEWAKKQLDEYATLDGKAKG